MKTFFIFFLAGITCFTAFGQNGRPAGELLQTALNTAKTQHKNILISFTATWCQPCKYLKRGIYDVYNVQYFERNYVLLELYSNEMKGLRHLENQGADSILNRFKGDTSVVPYWLILAPNGKKLYGESGFSSNPDDLKNFVKTLKRTSHLTDAELEMIYSRFNQLSKLAID